MGTDEREMLIKYLIRHGHNEENLRNKFSDEKLQELYNLVNGLFNG